MQNHMGANVPLRRSSSEERDGSDGMAGDVSDVSDMPSTLDSWGLSLFVHPKLLFDISPPPEWSTSIGGWEEKGGLQSARRRTSYCSLKRKG